MKGKEFIDRATQWAKAHDVDWRVEVSRGKGGHRLLYVGESWTTVPSGEIRDGTYRNMLRQLNIPEQEF